MTDRSKVLPWVGKRKLAPYDSQGSGRRALCTCICLECFSHIVSLKTQLQWPLPKEASWWGAILPLSWHLTSAFLCYFVHSLVDLSLHKLMGFLKTDIMSHLPVSLALTQCQAPVDHLTKELGRIIRVVFTLIIVSYSLHGPEFN